MKALSPTGIPSAAIAVGATSPNPGTPSLIWSSVANAVLVWNGTAWALAGGSSTPDYLIMEQGVI